MRLYTVCIFYILKVKRVFLGIGLANYMHKKTTCKAGGLEQGMVKLVPVY